MSFLSRISRTNLPLLLTRNVTFLQQKRFLYLHEYQSMALMQKYNINVPRYCNASTVEEAEKSYKSLAQNINGSNETDIVVKAQVLTGGRGLGYFKENQWQGGVHICSSQEELKKVANMMLGNTLVTKQTGLEGKPCNQILLAERFFIKKERYVAILMDRSMGGPVFLGSSVGGTSIEDIAEKNPSAIIKIPIDMKAGPTEEQYRQFVTQLGFRSNQYDEALKCIKNLYKLFSESDCLLVEINPFAETHDGRVLVCDAKLNFDDNASYRQKEIFKQKDDTQIDKREIEAEKYNLNYVGLDGNIGCMVNGAGLAMATMDIIQLHGASPANFLDVGGGADNTQVMQALRILQEDSRVSSIFVNIFGGIMRCDIIATGLIEASEKIGLTKPLVVRLEGTNKEKAKKLLDNSGMKIFFENDFSEAAKKAVNMAMIIDLAKKSNLSVTIH